MSLHELTAGLKDDTRGLLAVRAYYTVVDLVGRLASTRLPVLADWSNREMATCS